LEKLSSRALRKTISGSGDKR